MKRRWLSFLVAVVLVITVVSVVAFAIEGTVVAATYSISEDEARLNIAGCVAEVGSTVELRLGVQSTCDLKALSLSGLTYDCEKLELLSGAWAEMGQSLAGWDADT